MGVTAIHGRESFSDPRCKFSHGLRKVASRATIANGSFIGNLNDQVYIIRELKTSEYE